MAYAFSLSLSSRLTQRSVVLYGNGFLQSAIIESDQKERLMIWKIREKCFVICLIDKTIVDPKAIESIDESLAIIEQSKFSLNSIFSSTESKIFHKSTFFTNRWECFMIAAI